ncbi:MAG: leucine-rich repeat domain-containing protein [Christensenella sp.]
MQNIIKNKKIVIAVLMVMAFALVSCAADKIKFKDAEFEGAVRETLDKPYGAITQNDVLGITQLSLPNTVTDISELKYFKNLEELILMDSKVSDISALAELVHLKSLWLSGNKITDWSPVARIEDVKGRP